VTNGSISSVETQRSRLRGLAFVFSVSLWFTAFFRFKNPRRTPLARSPQEIDVFVASWVSFAAAHRATPNAERSTPNVEVAREEPLMPRLGSFDVQRCGAQPAPLALTSESLGVSLLQEKLALHGILTSM